MELVMKVNMLMGRKVEKANSDGLMVANMMDTL